MPVRITCRGTKLSDDFSRIVEEKVGRLKKYFEKVDRIDVIFVAEKHRRKCEINVHAGRFDCTAAYENGNEAAAFEKALKAMQRQIKENKVRMVERKQNSVNLAKMGRRSGKALRMTTPEITP